MWKQFLRSYLNFTRKERKGVIGIVIIILVFVFLPFFYPLFIKHKQYSYSDFTKEIDALNIEKNDSVSDNKYSKNDGNDFDDDYSLNGGKKFEILKAEVFYFDPNTATAADWKRLGIRDKTIHTIQNYLSKGGKFYKPEDIGKIWGLSALDAQRLIPYVSIKKEAKENITFEKKEYPKISSPYAAKPIQPIDVNLADTTAFIGLPGIGSKLAQRIIAFRNKLGGFYSIDQVGETYLLPDSTFQKIKPRLILANNNIKQMNINIASIDEMKVHPYLRYNLANAIFQYRQQHGNFNSIEEIKKIMLVTEDMYNKVSPYLSVK
ncbi:MAG TPA: helix-hairpin-helix domain-containing protein [Ginsengibacter sp.]